MPPIRVTDRRRRRSLALVLPALLIGALCAPLAQTNAQAPISAESCPPSTLIVTPAQPVIQPTHPPAPEQVLVCVGSRAITGVVFEHWSTVARKSEGSGPRLAQGALIGEVMKFLISSDWMIGEAAALHIHVSAVAVKRTFNRIRGEEFHTHREFKKFLERSGETVADLMLRVKVNLLSARIQKHVVVGQRSEAGKRRALAHFVESFKHSWTARTYCSPEYSSADCGHIQAPPL